MSMIVNGFRLTSNDIWAAERKIRRFSEMLKEHHKNAIATFLARHATRIIDDHACMDIHYFSQKERDKLSEDVQHPLSLAWRDMMDRQRDIKKTGYRDPEVDFEFTIQIFLHGKSIYGRVVSEDSDWMKMWFSQKGVEDFSYWDNTDRDEAVPAREWANRKRIWKKIFEKTPNTSILGWQTSCTNEYLDIPKEEHHIIPLWAPDWDSRVNRLATNILISEYKNALTENPDEYKEDIFSIIFDAKDWMKTEEGKARKKELKVEIEARLKRDLTLEDMKSGIQPVAHPTP